MATRVGRLGFDPQAPFLLKRGERVAWKRHDGTPDPELQGTVSDGTCEYEVGGGWHQPPVYVITRDDGSEFAAAELNLISLGPSDLRKISEGVRLIGITSGNAEVVISGSVIGYLGNPIEFVLSLPEDSLRLIVKFQDEEGNSQLRVEGKKPDPKTQELTLFNFGSYPFGAGSQKPLELGRLKGQSLYFHYRAYPLMNSDKMLHYTFYLGEQIAPTEPVTQTEQAPKTTAERGQ